MGLLNVLLPSKTRSNTRLTKDLNRGTHKSTGLHSLHILTPLKNFSSSPGGGTPLPGPTVLVVRLLTP